MKTAADVLPELTRRRLLQAGAGTLLTAGLPLLNACGGSDDVLAPSPTPPPSATQTRTFFFNHSHLGLDGQETHLQLGGAHRLVPIATRRNVLARERGKNPFLAAVPDEHITHVLEDLPMDPAYSRPWFASRFVGTDQIVIDGMYLLLPAGVAAERAFASLRAKLGAGQPLPRSRRRRRYGLPAAASGQDLADEAALVDVDSHAQALASWLPDTLSLDASSAYTVVQGYAADSDNVGDLADKITQLGTAAPAVTPGQLNSTGWATLNILHDAQGRPVVNNDPGSDWNGRKVYLPKFHPDVARLVAKAATQDVLPNVQQDASLGADITSRPPAESLRGKLWLRSDGKTSQAAALSASPAAAGEATQVAVNWVNSGNSQWFDFDSSVSTAADGTLVLDFTFTNKALRYLGCYIEFLDLQGNLLTLDSMPGYADESWIESPAGVADTLNPQATRQYLGVILPIGTVMGIPVYTDAHFYGSLEGRIKLSKQVAKIRVYAAGLGVGSTDNYQLCGPGAAGTLLVNYALTILFGSLGAVTSLEPFQSSMLQVAGAVFNILGSAIGDTLAGTGVRDAGFWEDQGTAILNSLLSAVSDGDGLLKVLGQLIIAALADAAATSAIEKAIPIVGLVFAAVSAAVALADLTLTSVQLFQSPLVYTVELSLTHDIAVTLLPDCNDTSFPKAANLLSAVLTFDQSQYSVSYEKALGSADLDQPQLKIEITPGPGQAPIPRGGKCSIAVQFRQRNASSDVLLGSAATGWVDNVEPASFTIRITEKNYPIRSGTSYQHVQRLYRDSAAAGQSRVWVDAPAPALGEAATGCGVAGEVCDYNDLIVRQGTSAGCSAGTITAIGYGWRGVDLGTSGDIERLALIDADTPASAFVQSYPVAQGVARLAFSRDPGGANNFYVDGSSGRPMVRGVVLDGTGAPTIDGAASNRAYGVLSYPSAALLVHPNGSLISVCAGVDRLEMLRPARTAVDDATAAQAYRSVVVGLSGSLPGQFSSVVNATIAPDGTLLVLEGGSNNRIQAFDLGMSPVRYFPSTVSGGPPEYTLQLSDLPPADGWVHLDVEAEMAGFVYLLSHNIKTGQEEYRVSIYDRNGSQLSALTHVSGVNAMRIALDHWRTLYSLNRAPMTYRDLSGQPNATEPSISRWVPCAAC